MKRIFDIFFSILLLFVFSPAFLIIAVLIKKEDNGIVFYKGIRVGKNRKLFKMFKFRTMVTNADSIGGPSTADNDPRITKIGSFLRKYKLDEIPQLINVLRGDMSFVGPRPEVEYYINMFSGDENSILTVKPGITDFASLWNSDEGSVLAESADPEKAYIEKIRPEKIRLQLKYVKERSFWTDLIIICKTIMKVIKR